MRDGPVELTAIWLFDLFFVSIAPIVAVLGVAFIGFWMLSGRLDVRFGLRSLLAIFLIFGAPAIAGALLQLGSVDAPSDGWRVSNHDVEGTSQEPEDGSQQRSPYSRSSL